MTIRQETECLDARAREARDLSFCFLCGGAFERSKLALRNVPDHLPQAAIFAKEDRTFPLKVASHYRCNNDWSKADEALGQLISVVRGKFPEPDKMRFGLTVANHGSTSEPVLGATGVHIEHHVIRWVRGVHAALYKEFLPDQPETNFCVSLPFPRLLSGQRARRLTVGLDQNHLTFVEELKKNRMAGRMDRIRCNNGKFTYECVWTKADQGEPCCIFGMNIYGWNRLGPAHLPQRSW